MAKRIQMRKQRFMTIQKIAQEKKMTVDVPPQQQQMLREIDHSHSHSSHGHHGHGHHHQHASKQSMIRPGYSNMPPPVSESSAKQSKLKLEKKKNKSKFARGIFAILQFRSTQIFSLPVSVFFSFASCGPLVAANGLARMFNCWSNFTGCTAQNAR